MKRHYHRKSFRKRVRNWLKDARFRQQRRYVFVGMLVSISGLIIAGGISVFSSNLWGLIIITFIILVAWSFIKFYDDV